jgi:eukaryotic-like serine/threonine-protein kinase
MNAERWQRVQAVFRDAVERVPEARGAFLREACGNDVELREEVETLLESHDQAGAFLEQPAWTAEPRPLSPGMRLGRYEVKAMLGAGGMGEVYRAGDERLGRDVAVKVLPADFLSNPDRLQRFEQEARAASALNHPQILAVYDVGRHAGVPYMVTELLEGVSLADRIRQGPVPLRRALEWAAQAARGLGAAHDRGIVHRDVKPGNLFVTGDGQLKILDFGLAKVATAEAEGPGGSAARTTPGTSPGAPVGTAGYMSPEQVRGEALDSRSDQFSLGCVVYELLTGKAPFQRPTGAESIAAVLVDEPTPVGERNPRVPRDVTWIVERCLAKDPQDRYAATRDLARDLELSLGRLSSSGGTPPETRRGPQVAALVAAGLALTLLGVLAWRLRSPESVPAPTLHYVTYSGSDASPAASPDGRTIVFSSRRDGRRRIWMMQTAAGSEVPLTAGDDDYPRFSPDGTAILFARRIGNRVSLFRVPSIGGEPRLVIDDAFFGDFSPDGRRIAFVRYELRSDWLTVLGTATVDGSDVRTLARLTGRALAPPRWSKDGATLVVATSSVQAGQGRSIQLVDALSGRSRLLEPGGVAAEDVTWAGSRTLAYSQRQIAVSVYNANSASVVLQDVAGSRRRTVLSVPFDISMLDVLGAGRVILEARSFRVGLKELALDTAAPESGRWLTRGSSSDREPVYDPAGEWIVFSSNRGGNLDLWATSRYTGAVRRLTEDKSQDWDPAFTRDGQLLWSNDRSGSFEVWIARRDGRDSRQVTRDGVDAENPTATPDGQWIVYASGNPRGPGIFKIRPDGREVTLLVAGNMQMPELSPDGSHVAFVADLGSDRAALRVARVSDGALLPLAIDLPAWVPAGDVDVGRCRWLPDGRSIAFVGRDEFGSYGIYSQGVSGTAATTRRRLLALEPGLAAESLGISPDGKHLTVAYLDLSSNLMLAEHVPGVGEPREGR